MSSGATFDWTFPQAFAGNTAPVADSTDIATQGVIEYDAARQTTPSALAPQATRTTEVEQQ